MLPYAQDLKGKLLVMHGMADDNVLFLQWFTPKHGLIRQHDGRHAYATIKRFFDESLRP